MSVDILEPEAGTTSSRAPVEGPAFPLFVKVLASLLVASLAVSAVRVAGDILGTSWTPGTAVVLLIAAGMVAVCFYWILRSRTGIDETHIRQSWLWDKEVALADVAHIKFVSVPYLGWLIAPRLVVRARGRGLIVFHAADTQVLQAFARISLGIA